MVGPSGVGEPGFKPIEPGGKGGPEGPTVSGAQMESILHSKVKNLEELKALLVKNLGEKEGMKLYNDLVQSIVMVMLEQVQQSAEQAKKAAQQMRTPNV